MASLLSFLGSQSRSLAKLPAVTVAGLGLVALLGLGACSPLQGAASGSQCFSSVDCAAGLACVPKGSISICSSNISGIETELDSGVDGGNGDAGPIPKFDATNNSDSGMTGTDASIPDTSAPPQKDTGGPPPPVDAGHPVDTGTPQKDTGGPPPPVDAGHDAGHDAGMPPPVDAGSDVQAG